MKSMTSMKSMKSKIMAHRALRADNIIRSLSISGDYAFPEPYRALYRAENRAGNRA